MAQKILPSGHLMECFAPYRGHEARMIEVIRRAAALGFYKNLEIGCFFDKANRRTVRNILEENGLTATVFVTAYVKDQKLSLCDLEEGGRRRAIDLCRNLIDLTAETGHIHVGVPSGDDPGMFYRGLAKQKLTDSLVELAEHAKQYGMNLMVEPLDRYAFKKQLIGPMEETVVWFEELHEAAPNTFIHWDSAHEMLGGIDLMKSMELAAPFFGQMHLCDCITEPDHPCFGDLHMDCAHEPNWTTEGFMTPEIGAELLRKAASFETPSGVENVYAAVEITGHPGDDLWLLEEHGRKFLEKTMKMAGLL